MGGEGKSFYVGSDVAKSIYLEKERGNKMRIHNFLSSDTAFFGAGLSRNSRQQKVENLMNQKQSLLVAAVIYPYLPFHLPSMGIPVK